MRTAPPVRSPLACTICLKFLDDSVIARAYLFCRLPTLPLACFLAPIPPTPFPSGEGGDYKLILPGAPPPAPRHQTAYGTDSPCRCSTPEGGLPSWSPAAPAFSLLFCPLYRRGRMDSPAPIPPTPFPAGRGDFSFLMQGAPPLASPRLSRKRHGLGEHWRYPAGGLRLDRRLACHRYARRSGANKAGTLKIHRAADRRQAAGRSSRAEYSEVPGIVGPLSGSDGSFFVILPDRRSSFYGEKRPPGRPGQAPQSHRRWRCRIRTCYPFRQ